MIRTRITFKINTLYLLILPPDRPSDCHTKHIPAKANPPIRGHAGYYISEMRGMFSRTANANCAWISKSKFIALLQKYAA